MTSPFDQPETIEELDNVKVPVSDIYEVADLTEMDGMITFKAFYQLMRVRHKCLPAWPNEVVPNQPTFAQSSAAVRGDYYARFFNDSPEYQMAGQQRMTYDELRRVELLGYDDRSDPGSLAYERPNTRDGDFEYKQGKRFSRPQSAGQHDALSPVNEKTEEGAVSGIVKKTPAEVRERHKNMWGDPEW